MNAPDDDRDVETTADWPGSQRGSADDDGEATTVVPKTPQQSAPPSMSPPPRPTPAVMPPPPMPPPRAGQWDPRWQMTPGPGSPPPPNGLWAPSMAPGQYPPGPHPPAPNPPKGRRWTLLGIGTLVLVVTAVAVTVFVTRDHESSSPAARSTTSAPTPTTNTTASSPSSTAAANVDPTALKGLMASVADVTQIANNATMTPTLTQDSPLFGVHVEPFECTGAVMTAMNATYGGAGTAFAVQLLNNGPENIDAIQALTSFRNEADAKAFVDRQFEDWQSCDDTDVTVTVDGRYGGPPQHGVIGHSENTNGSNVVSISPPPGVEGRRCQHVMSARKNVVIDVRVCAPDVRNMGLDLDRAIGDKITGQR